MGIFGRRKKEEPAIAAEKNQTEINVEEDKYRQRIFAERVIFADVVLQTAYIQIKNELLSFKGVKSRLSRRADTFTCGDKIICKIAMTDKTMKIFFPLKLSEIPSKIKVEYKGGVKAYCSVPIMYKIKSAVACKKAITLVDKTADKFSLVKKERCRKINAVNVAEDYLIDYAQRTKKRSML